MKSWIQNHLKMLPFLDLLFSMIFTHKPFCKNGFNKLLDPKPSEKCDIIIDFYSGNCQRTGHNARTCARETWREGNLWAPVQSDNEQEEAGEREEEAEEEDNERGVPSRTALWYLSLSLLGKKHLDIFVYGPPNHNGKCHLDKTLNP